MKCCPFCLVLDWSCFDLGVWVIFFIKILGKHDFFFFCEKHDQQFTCFDQLLSSGKSREVFLVIQLTLVIISSKGIFLIISC